MLSLQPTHLIAFDPGDTTGVAIVQGGKPISTYTISMQCMINTIATKTSVFYTWKKTSIWIAEDFLLYPAKAAGQAFSKIPSAQVLGMLSVAAAMANKQLILQRASDVKQFATDDRIRSWGWNVQHMSTHERDAIRHALFYLFKNLK